MATTSYLNQNQFAQQPIIGSVDLTVGPANVISVLLNPDSVSANPITAGQGVKLIAGDSTQILVDVVADVQDLPFGLIVFDNKKNTYLAGRTVEIALEGTVMVMECSAAINRGAFVSLTPSGPTVVTQTTGARLGVALDQTDGANQLLRIMIQRAVVAS